jgi:hypothetical protein
MGKLSMNFTNYISLAVMLLMVVALVAGQAGASDNAVEDAVSVAPVTVLEDRLNIDLRGHIGDQPLKVSIAVATDLSHFRGEDE